MCDGASSACPCSEIRASRQQSPWLLPLLTVQHKSLRLQPLQLILASLNSPDLGVQETAQQDQAREGLPQRPTQMLGSVCACTVATRQHSICINAATAWCVTFWRCGPGASPGKSPRQSQQMLPQPVFLLCTASWSRPGPARAAEAWTSTATAHRRVTAGAGEGSEPASPAVSPLPIPLSASVDSFTRGSWELTACGIGTQGMERRL